LKPCPRKVFFYVRLLHIQATATGTSTPLHAINPV